MIVATVYGCNDANLTDKNLTEDRLTREFELQKGKMRPIQEYDSTILSQNRSLPLYSTGCITTDQQVYIFKNNCNVESVSAGEVTKIIKSDLGIAILIRSGKYLTVYRYLDGITVNVGELIQRGRPIGMTPTLGQFYFEIYKAGSKLNPSEWVKV
jgi:hypothetical protein